MNKKLQFAIQRAVLTIISLWAVITILFLLFRFLPGDPSDRLVDPRFTDEQRQALLAQYGLDEPLHIQYISYMSNFVQGDLGQSFEHGTAVLPFILDRTVNTLVLTLPAIFAAFLIGPLLGAIFAWYRNSRVDSIGTATILLLYAAPIFWTGMIAIMIFAFQWDLLPSGGMRGPGFIEESIFDRVFSLETLRHAILPIVIFFLWRLSRPTLITRNNMIDVLDSNFIELKRAGGIPQRKLIFRHGLRNSLLPVVHFGALAIGFAFGGSVILETVFSWPGLGRAMWRAVLAHDYPVVQGAFFLMSAMIIIFNLFADIVSVYIDPRVTDEEVVE